MHGAQSGFRESGIGAGKRFEQHIVVHARHQQIHHLTAELFDLEVDTDRVRFMARSQGSRDQS